MIDIKKVQDQAKKELEEERFREAVEEAKVKLKNRRGWFYFPFKLVIVRR